MEGLFALYNGALASCLVFYLIILREKQRFVEIFGIQFVNFQLQYCLPYDYEISRTSTSLFRFYDWKRTILLRRFP